MLIHLVDAHRRLLEEQVPIYTLGGTLSLWGTPAGWCSLVGELGKLPVSLCIQDRGEFHLNKIAIRAATIVDDVMFAVQPGMVDYYTHFIEHLKTKVHRPTDVKTEKWPKSFLNLKLTYQQNGSILISQPFFIDKLLQLTNMENCKDLKTFNPSGNMRFSRDNCPESEKEKQEVEKWPVRQTVGCMLYLSLMTRPCLSRAVSAASTIVSNPSKTHWKDIQKLVGYAKGTRGQGIVFEPNGPMEITSAVDADWAGDDTTRKSISGWVIFLGNGPVLWKQGPKR